MTRIHPPLARKQVSVNTSAAVPYAPPRPALIHGCAGDILSLFRRRHGRRLPYHLVVRLTLDIALGLRYLHEHKPSAIVHRWEQLT